MPYIDTKHDTFGIRVLMDYKPKSGPALSALANVREPHI